MRDSLAFRTMLTPLVVAALWLGLSALLVLLGSLMVSHRGPARGDGAAEDGGPFDKLRANG